MSFSKEPRQGQDQGSRSTPGSDNPTTGASSLLNARRRRPRLGQQSDNRLSRPLAAALIVILAGGAYLFWPRGGTVSLGIGEQLTVVTADSLMPTKPRSGSVDIESEVQPLVAEKPDPLAAPPTATSEHPIEKAQAREEEPRVSTPAAPKPSTPPPSSAERPRPTSEPQKVEQSPIQPRPTGGWAVQVGAYGSEANAEVAANRLKGLGIDAQVRAASTASGGLIYRVWIGWFQSREQALAYAEQEKRRIGEAHPVHR